MPNPKDTVQTPEMTAQLRELLDKIPVRKPENFWDKSFWDKFPNNQSSIDAPVQKEF